MTKETFDKLLLDLVQNYSAKELLAIPEIYNVLVDVFGDQVYEAEEN